MFSSGNLKSDRGQKGSSRRRDTDGQVTKDEMFGSPGNYSEKRTTRLKQEKKETRTFRL